MSRSIRMPKSRIRERTITKCETCEFEGDTEGCSRRYYQLGAEKCHSEYLVTCINSIEPTLNLIKNIPHKGAIITIYESSNGKVVLGGLGWYERFDWEKQYWGNSSEDTVNSLKLGSKEETKK